VPDSCLDTGGDAPWRARATNSPPKVTTAGGRGVLKTDGPLVSSHMRTFATKLGFALFYEVTRKIVPMAGGVAARWYSNVDRFDGTFPQSVFDVLLPPETLRQGKFNVSDQFSYQWCITEGDRAVLFFASFRHSFAVLAFAATDRSIFDVEAQRPRPRSGTGMPTIKERVGSYFLPLVVSRDTNWIARVRRTQSAAVLRAVLARC
jgi:hypothetical protein